MKHTANCLLTVDTRHLVSNTPMRSNSAFMENTCQPSVCLSTAYRLWYVKGGRSALLAAMLDK